MAGDEGYPQREVEQEIAPGHGPNDEIYHTYTDEHGNIVKQYDMDAEEITVTPGAHVDWNTVVGQMVAIAQERADAQIPYVMQRSSSSSRTAGLRSPSSSTRTRRPRTRSRGRRWSTD
jgi:hypothetical protein